METKERHDREASKEFIVGYPIAAGTAIGAASGYASGKTKELALRPTLAYVEKAVGASKKDPIAFRRSYSGPHMTNAALMMMQSLPGGDKIKDKKNRRELAYKFRKKVEEIGRLESEGGGVKDKIKLMRARAALLSDEDFERLMQEDRNMLKKMRRYLPSVQKRVKAMPAVGAIKGGLAGLGIGGVLGLLAKRKLEQGESNG